MNIVYVIKMGNGEFCPPNGRSIKYYTELSHAKSAIKGLETWSNRGKNPRIYKVDLDKISMLCEEL